MAFPYLQDILDQPEALQRTLDALKAAQPLPDFLSSGKIRRVVLTGMGSSYYALHLLNNRLVERGLLGRDRPLAELLGAGLAHGHRPVGDAAHHHALEHRLPADG